jgi:hypothetical protein
MSSKAFYYIQQIFALAGAPCKKHSAVHNFNRVTLFPVEADVDEQYTYNGKQVTRYFLLLGCAARQPRRIA